MDGVAASFALVQAVGKRVPGEGGALHAHRELGHAVERGERAAVPRAAVVVEDDLAVELVELRLRYGLGHGTTSSRLRSPRRGHRAPPPYCRHRSWRGRWPP